MFQKLISRTRQFCSCNFKNSYLEIYNSKLSVPYIKLKLIKSTTTFITARFSFESILDTLLATQDNLAGNDQCSIIHLYRSVQSSKNHEIKSAYTRLIIEQLSSFTLCLNMIIRSSKKMDKSSYGIFISGQILESMCFKLSSCYVHAYHA